MTHIRPFRAVRPVRDKVHLVGSRSYVSYSAQDLDDKLKGNPYTFLHIIKPELHEGIRSDIPKEERYRLIESSYNEFKEEEIFLKDAVPCYYIYRQTKGEDEYTGIIASVSVDDYNNGEIKIHEQTISKREELFTEYLANTGFNAEPVLLAFRDCSGVKEFMSKVTSHRAEYEFSTTDKVKHEVWIVSDKERQKELQDLMLDIPQTYIADGHHRCASSARLAELDNPKVSKDLSGYFMAYLIPQSYMHIYDFNRLVSTGRKLEKDELVSALTGKFYVEEKEGTYRPRHMREFGMYFQGTWFSIKLKEEPSGGPVEMLDAKILTDNILTPVFDIQDLKTDDRVGFIDGTHGMEGIQHAVDSGKYNVGFALYPITFDQLKEVADSGGIMPPKSTWIEPKLRSGITVYELY